MSKPPVVAVFNSTPDIVELLRIVLEHAGYVVVSAYTYDIRDNKVDVEMLMRAHDPKLIIYDIAPPYEENWRLFQHICTMPPFRGMRFMLTTTNVKRVREAAAVDHELFEIVGKPYDLGMIVEAVKSLIGPALARKE